MNDLAQISFRRVMEALLDENTPFNPRFLYRFTDLDTDEVEIFEEIWPQVSSWRRKALLEDLESLHEKDYLLSFERMGRSAVQDAEGPVRQLAARLLWEYEAHDLASIYLNLLENDVDAEVRAVSAQGLGRFLYLAELEELPEDIWRNLEERMLRAAQADESILVRRRVLESLGYSSREEVIPLIETAYASGNRDWVASALYAMGRSANDMWEERVIAMFDHSYPTVRTEAARAAGELELREAVVGLLELLYDDSEDVRYAAIWSLSQIGGEGVRDALEELAEETEDDEEGEFIEDALDNLSFTEDLELFTLFDLPGSQGLPHVNGEEEEVDLLDLIDEDALDEED
jgi:HEAT repeat protein